jgi:hypothetical protein
MALIILIEKILEKTGVHYYRVSKENNLNEINYYLGLDTIQKKLLFFEDNSFQDPKCVYDLANDTFEKSDRELLSRINWRVKFKCFKAFTENKFPESISWEG